jgi:N-acetylmuramoyl-L-alanine amidase
MAVSFPAHTMTGVLLKFSQQEGSMRIVLEAEESFIQKMKVTASPSNIKIDFPEPFHLTSPKDLPFELISADRSLVINLKEKADIKFFRLSSPSRLVLDIRKPDTQALDSQKKAIPPEKQALSPEKQPAPVLLKSFVIDAGHGGYDFGIAFGNVSEKDITLSLAKDLGALLVKKGRKVFLVRRVDQHISFADRISLVNQKNPDAFISLHLSVSRNFVVYAPKVEEQTSNETLDSYSVAVKQKKYVAKSKALSENIIKAIKEEFKEDVFHRDMPLPVLNSVGAPSVLIEFPSPQFVTYDQQMKTRIINVILNGIAAYGQ